MSFWFSHDSMPKMLGLNTLTPFFYFITFYASRKTYTKFTIHPKKKGPTRHHSMQQFHFITPIILLFHESRNEKRTNHAITSCITFTPSRQLFCGFTNHFLKKWSITPSRLPLLVRLFKN